MTISAKTLRLLMEAGLSGEQLLAVVESIEASDTAPTRSPAAARQAAYRERKRNAERNAVDNERDITAPHVRSAPVVIPFSSSLRSEEVGGGGGECASARFPSSDDWPDGKATDHVKLLVEVVASPRLDPSKAPGLITTSGRLAAWKRDGASWEHDVVPVVTAVCAKQRSPVSTWKFFDQAIARSIADNRAALEIPDATARAPPGLSITDRLAAEKAEARRRVLEDG